VTIDIPWRSIFRLLTVVVLVWLWFRLWQWILLLVIAIFLAVGLDPVVTWLEAHRVRRTCGGPLVLLLAGLLIAFGYLLTGIFDFVPVIGVFLTLFPMVLLALTVSMWTAIATVIFNAAYNALETYTFHRRSTAISCGSRALPSFSRSRWGRSLAG
jgi:predicted PurR-regulated permease PerM